MEFIAEDLSKYVEDHTSPESDLLNQINRETHLEVLKPRMLSGHLQGRVLSMISKMLSPDRILEIGTYTGYSAICLAEGLSQTGVLHTIDKNEELSSRVKAYFEKAGKTDQIKLHLGNAAEIIPALEESWDLVFIDADKINYSHYYDLVFERVRTGGFLVADNVLWSGKVIDDKKSDEDTEALRAFNQKMHEDDRVENVLLPVRDGLMIVRKK